MGKDELDDQELLEISNLYIMADVDDNDSLDMGEIKAIILQAVRTNKFVKYLSAEDQKLLNATEAIFNKMGFPEAFKNSPNSELNRE